MTPYVAIYLNNEKTYEVLYFDRNGKVVELRTKDYIKNGVNVDVKALPVKKTMTFSELRFYLDNLKYLLRKDTKPCKTMQVMSGIYPSVIITPDEFSDTTIDAVMHSLDV
jgi:superfamily II DNA or RNA helicase